KQHHTQGIQVGARVHVATAVLLRAHVFGCANNGAHLGHGVVAKQGPGDAEVHQYGRAVGAKHDVVRFDVAMNDVLFAGVVEGGGHVTQYGVNGVVVEAVLAH